MSAWSLASPADFNQQVSSWLTTMANWGSNSTLGCLAGGLVLPLPPVMPQLGWHASTRLPGDQHVRIGPNGCSVDPVAIGRLADVHPDPTMVAIRGGDQLAGAHARRWGHQVMIHDPAHRADLGEPGSVDCLGGEPTLDEVVVSGRHGRVGLLEAVAHAVNAGAPHQAVHPLRPYPQA